MRRGSVAIGVPLLWAIGGVAVLTVAWLSGFVVAGLTANRPPLQDTYYVVAHRDVLSQQAAVFGVFAGLYYLFPRVTGFSYSKLLGKVHFWLSFIGIGAGNVALAVVLAYLPRDLSNSPDDALRYANLASQIGAYVAAAGILVFFVNLALAFWRRRPAQ
jgi:cytochrome c oxidase subunit 1